MKYYREKWEYLISKHSRFCPIAWQQEDILIPATELHHLAHQTKWRRKKYPLFIDSLLNLRPVNNAWHLSNPSWGKISDFQAKKWERFLKRHKKACVFVNEVR